jgi:hypothetical protein
VIAECPFDATAYRFQVERSPRPLKKIISGESSLRASPSLIVNPPRLLASVIGHLGSRNYSSRCVVSRELNRLTSERWTAADHSGFPLRVDLTNRFAKMYLAYIFCDVD